MIRIMLVDDEPFIRVAIKTLFPWEKYGFQIVSEASEGKSAFEKLTTESIDLIITDIKMPTTDGISLIRQVKQAYPQILCIVLSNYDDFTLTRDAFREGALDYLLKGNLNIDSFNALIQRLKKNFLLNAKSDVSALPSNSAPEIHNWILELLVNGYEISEQLISQLDPKEPYIISSIQLRACGSEQTMARSDYTENFIKSTVLKIIHEISEFRLFSHAVSTKEYVLLIYSQEKTEKAFFDKLKKFFHLLTTNISIYLNCYTITGISKLYVDANGMSNAYINAKKLSDYIFYKKESFQYYDSTFKSDIQETKNYVSSNIEKLSSYIREQNWSNLESFFTELLSLIQKTLYPPTEAINLVSNIEFLLSNEMTHIFHLNFDFLFENTPHAQNAKTKNIEELRKNAQEFFLSLREASDQAMPIPDNCSPIVTEAIQKILENYTNPDVNLGNIAASIAVNPSYLSRIFHKETGQHFNSYLTFLRLSHAKILLRSTKDSISTISEKCGYNNSKYFINIFKKTEGQTPSAYRNSSEQEG